MYKLTLTDNNMIVLEFTTTRSITLDYNPFTGNFNVCGKGDNSIRYSIKFLKMQSSVSALILDIVEFMTDDGCPIIYYYDGVSMFLESVYNLYYRNYICHNNGSVFNILNTYSVVITDQIKIYYRNLLNPDIISPINVKLIIDELQSYLKMGNKLINNTGFMEINNIVNKHII